MNKEGLYRHPALYDLAFSYRDYEADANTLLAWYQQLSGVATPPKTVLELACGPGIVARYRDWRKPAECTDESHQSANAVGRADARRASGVDEDGDGDGYYISTLSRDLLVSDSVANSHRLNITFPLKSVKITWASFI